MNKIILIILLIIITIALVVLGFFIGSYYQYQQTNSVFGSIVNPKLLLKTLNSGIINLTVTTGKVELVNDGTIVVSKENQTLAVPMRTDARLFYIGTGGSVMKKASLAVIKKGDIVTLYLHINSSGEIEGTGGLLYATK